MNRTDHSMSGFLGLRMAEESKLAEYWHGEYESHSPGPKYYVPIDEVEGDAPFDFFDEESWKGRKAAIIQSCKLFQEEIKAKCFQATSMMQLYGLISEVNDWDDALPQDIVPSWNFLERFFCVCEGRVRALVRKTIKDVRRAVFNWIKNNQEEIITIGTAIGKLYAFHPREQYAYAEVAIQQ